MVFLAVEGVFAVTHEGAGWECFLDGRNGLLSSRILLGSSILFLDSSNLLCWCGLVRGGDASLLGGGGRDSLLFGRAHNDLGGIHLLGCGLVQGGAVGLINGGGRGSLLFGRALNVLGSIHHLGRNFEHVNVFVIRLLFLSMGSNLPESNKGRGKH